MIADLTLRAPEYEARKGYMKAREDKCEREKETKGKTRNQNQNPDLVQIAPRIASPTNPLGIPGGFATAPK